MDALITSIIKRPYVFAFLVAYLILAWRLWGWRRTLFWLISGYFIAWLSEYSSIHNGFPYGEYHYIYENLRGELIVAGVPFFDSLSYVFLTFAGYTTAGYLLSRPETRDPGSGKSKSPFGSRVSGLGSRVFLGAFLTTLLDVIIDPIATMGDKWFLGSIHYYVYPGWYFGVPLSNFGGWFLVSLAVIGVNLLVWSTSPRFFVFRVPHPESRVAWLNPTFYTSIALFSIVISFWVGEWRLGLVSLAILGLVISFIAVVKHERLATSDGCVRASPR